MNNGSRQRCDEGVTAWQQEEIEGECGGGQTFQEVLKVVKILKEDVCAIMIKQKWKKDGSKVDFISNRLG